MSQLESRLVRIFTKSQGVQSGTQDTLAWRMQWEDTKTKRWTNPLMGWTSTSDPLSNTHMTLEFDTKEAAISFAQKNGARRAAAAPAAPPSRSRAAPDPRSLEVRGGGARPAQPRDRHAEVVLRQLHLEGTKGPRLPRPLRAAAAAAAAAQGVSARESDKKYSRTYTCALSLH